MTTYVHTLADTLANCIFDHDAKPLPKRARPLDDPAPVEIPPSEAQPRIVPQLEPAPPKMPRYGPVQRQFPAGAQARAVAVMKRKRLDFCDVVLGVVRRHPRIDPAEVARWVVDEERMSTSRARVHDALKTLRESGRVRRERAQGPTDGRLRPYLYEVAS